MSGKKLYSSKIIPNIMILTLFSKDYKPLKEQLEKMPKKEQKSELSNKICLTFFFPVYAAESLKIPKKY